MYAHVRDTFLRNDNTVIYNPVPHILLLYVLIQTNTETTGVILCLFGFFSVSLLNEGILKLD